MPCLDNKVVGWRANTCDHYLADVGTEAVRAGGAAVGLDLGRGPRDFGVTGPDGGVIIGIDGAAVQGCSTVASQVGRSAGTGHDAERQAVLGEIDLRPADPRRPVFSQRSHGVVLVRAEQLPGPAGQVRPGGG